jgi:hypothetical protein
MNNKELISNLALYHASNARHHHEQCQLCKDHLLPHGSQFQAIFNHHQKLALKHQNTAEALISRGATTQDVKHD